MSTRPIPTNIHQENITTTQVLVPTANYLLKPILENHGKLEAPYFDGCNTYPQDFINWMNGMKQFFEQANFANNKKVRYAKLKLRGKAQRFWENLEYFCYMRYEPAISVWEDMKKKLCDEYSSPYYRAKYLPQSQCDTFQVEANTMNPQPRPISCPQCTFEQTTKELSTKELKE